jgi:hypothetical protein
MNTPFLDTGLPQTLSAEARAGIAPQPNHQSGFAGTGKQRYSPAPTMGADSDFLLIQ